jgi:hypothetical protein
MVLYLCVLIVFSLHQESLKLILVDEPLPKVVLSHRNTGYVQPLGQICLGLARHVQSGTRYVQSWRPLQAKMSKNHGSIVGVSPNLA